MLGTICLWETCSPWLRCLLPPVMLRSRRDARQTALVEKPHNERAASRSDPLAPSHTTLVQEIGHRRRMNRLLSRSSDSFCNRLDTEWEYSSMLSSRLLREIIHQTCTPRMRC